MLLELEKWHGFCVRYMCSVQPLSPLLSIASSTRRSRIMNVSAQARIVSLRYDSQKSVSPLGVSSRAMSACAAERASVINMCEAQLVRHRLRHQPSFCRGSNHSPEGSARRRCLLLGARQQLWWGDTAWAGWKKRWGSTGLGRVLHMVESVAKRVDVHPQC